MRLLGFIALGILPGFMTFSARAEKPPLEAYGALPQIPTLNCRLTADMLRPLPMFRMGRG